MKLSSGQTATRGDGLQWGRVMKLPYLLHLLGQFSWWKKKRPISLFPFLAAVPQTTRLFIHTSPTIPGIIYLGLRRDNGVECVENLCALPRKFAGYSPLRSCLSLASLGGILLLKKVIMTKSRLRAKLPGECGFPYNISFHLNVKKLLVHYGYRLQWGCP